MATRKTGRTGADDKATSEAEGTLPETTRTTEASVGPESEGSPPTADSPDPDSRLPEAREAEAPVSEADAPASENMEAGQGADAAPGDIERPEADPAETPVGDADDIARVDVPVDADERVGLADAYTAETADVARTDAPVDRQQARAGAAAPYIGDREDIARTDAPEDATSAERGMAENRDDDIARTDAPVRPAAVPPNTTEDYAEDEDSGSSFAAKALTWLVLLLAGAGLGIWAAPKIAPSLPAGMAPVAAWLTPGQNTSETRIAEIESRLESQLSDLGAQISALSAPDDTEATIEALRSESVAQIAAAEAAIEELRETVGGLDGAESRQRIARVETALEGQTAELAGLKSQLTAGGTTEVGAMNSEQIDLYRSEIEGLRAEMAAVTDSVSVLSARIDEVAATADRSISAAQQRVDEVQAEAEAAMEEARSAAETRVATAEAEAEAAAISSALAAGQPFAEPVSKLAADPDIAVPDGLAAAAETGAPTITTLRESFPDAAHSAIRASIVAAAGDGVLAQSRAFMEAQVATRSLTPRQGLDPDAVLSRMEDHLRRDDLAAALTEAEDLPSEARDAMAGWLEDARRRLDAETGMEALRSSLQTSN